MLIDFGLAQLYQIRGRVGRSDRQAYSYITYKRNKMMNQEAVKRLKAIKEFTEFGSGFKIATRDLQIRGAGSLLGEIQHGHIEQVGYDMYNKLLQEVIKETKGEQLLDEKDVSIDINVSSFIPESYISDSAQKIEIYQDIADCRKEEDIQNVIDEIIDRYGDIPKEVNNLLEVARIKNEARTKNIEKIQQKQMGVVFTFSGLLPEQIQNIIKKYESKVQFSGVGKPYLTFRVEQNNLIKDIEEFIKNI